MNKFLATVLVAGCIASPLMAEEDGKFDVKASIDIQAQKEFYDDGSQNNVDALYGRVNFGAQYTSEKFLAGVNIRAYPAGFGYEPITGVNFDDVSWDIASATTEIAKFQVESAWAKYLFSDLFQFKIGRYWTSTTQTYHFGNYLDQDPGGSYMAKVAYHNASEFIVSSDIVSGSVLLGVGDKNVNRGYLRIGVDITPIEALEINLGYRANVFDMIVHTEEDVANRIAGSISYEFIENLKLYFAFGILDIDKPFTEAKYDWWDWYTNLYDSTSSEITRTDYDGYLSDYERRRAIKKYEKQKAFNIGCFIPTGPVFDKFVVEGEIIPDRMVAGEEKIADINVWCEKKIGSRVKMRGAFYTDPTRADYQDWVGGIRFSTTLK